MQQVVLLPRVSCNLCTKREAVNANEIFSRLGGPVACCVLREASTCTFHWPFIQVLSFELSLQKEQADAREAALAAEHGPDHSERYDSGDDETITAATPKSSKTARAYAKTYKPGPPLVPHIIVQRLLQYIGKVIIRQKEKFVLMVCKYWSLKREARRGAPLLKRLHLEPWTASSGSRQQGDEDKVMKLEVRNYTLRLYSEARAPQEPK